MNRNTQDANPEISGQQKMTVREEIPAGSPLATERLRAWSALQTLPHDALLTVYECDSVVKGGERVVYCVREATDEDLAGALAEGPLPADAVTELTTALRRGLAHLHGHGYTCGGIEASEVHASGERTKLYPLRLKEAASEADRAEDLRSLAMLAARATGAPAPGEISDPKLRNMALEILRDSQPATRSAAASLPQQAPAGGRSPLSPWVLIGAGLVVLAVVALLSLRGRSSVEERPTAASSTADERPSAFDTSPSRTASVEPVRPQISPRPTEVPERATKARSVEPTASQSQDGSWSVIAATYRSFDAAQRRANRLKDAFADCVCSVYPEKDQGANYYVIVGSNLSRNAADQMRSRAVQSGLPRDSYVTKLGDRTADSR